MRPVYIFRGLTVGAASPRVYRASVLNAQPLSIQGPAGPVGATGAPGATGATGAVGATGVSPWSQVGNDVIWTLGNVVVPKTSGVGIKVDSAVPTFGWADLLGAIHTRTGGGTIPTFAVYQGGVYQWSFGTAAGVTEVFNEYHIPHDYVPNTDIYIHTHWSTIAAPSGDVNWIYEVTYAKGYDQAAFEGFPGSGAPVVVPVVQAASTAFFHQIAEVQLSAPGGLITPAAVNVSITSGAAALTAAAPLFTAADLDRTVQVVGAGPAGGVLNTTIAGFTSTTAVTLAANAATTVVAQPNFRYRVIDTAVLEVDGLLLVRMWRNSARVADTLNVAPFVHFVDVHYQTNGVIGTKQRNGPGFYT